jgi:hypothetical protein
MRKACAIFCTLSAAAYAAGCTASASGPIGVTNEFNGVRYAAEVREIVSTTTQRFFVVATLTNTKGLAVSRSYPASCAVRVRLYTTPDHVLVYDETTVPCASGEPTELTLFPGESKTLQSGVRWPPDVLGDSLAAARYYVGAVVQTEGAQIVEIAAGVYRVPLCVEVPATTDSFGQTVCS